MLCGVNISRHAFPLLSAKYQLNTKLAKYCGVVFLVTYA